MLRVAGSFGTAPAAGSKDPFSDADTEPSIRGRGENGAHPAIRGMHILIVDDEPNMLRTLVDIFRDEGFEASAASSGQQAVTMCAANWYDVVLLDVRMPGIDGMEAFRRIRVHRPSIPVVMMSAYSVDHLTQEGLRDGVVAFIQKPLDVAKVLWMMRSLASHTHPGDPTSD